MARKKATKKKATRKKAGARNKEGDLARIRFSHSNTFSLGEAGAAWLAGILEVPTDGLRGALPPGVRDDDTEKAYDALDGKLLGSISAEVFFGNFSDPGLIFASPEEILVDSLSAVEGDASIDYLAIWDGEGGSEVLEVAVSVAFEFALTEGVDLSDEYPEDDALCGEIAELRNMFNFSVGDLEVADEDESFQHEWALV